ncbi:uncharacterized protein [Blastocystis hominis]|uniref:Succinate dehydrogenase assembly factor 4, mitochondrial n=1 Tax=Blastocystis hominis TaxID=12968 RepID=D8MBF5_BLAHO|nr:uncharacterized protein [Blastocystis hominis]CBK25394.2 unnamed protein product [Blastocystis hominis]|eukprot:XP_012899442.1 uncharacterized protein [Blastocystis hominis]
MISLFVRNGARALSAVRAVGVTTVQRSLFTNPFKSETEVDEANCPKAKAFDDLMDKKEQEKKAKPVPKNLKGDDYPFELEEEDYVEMIDPKTGEWNPPRGVFNNAEPTRYGDWEIKGRCYDF